MGLLSVHGRYYSVHGRFQLASRGASTLDLLELFLSWPSSLSRLTVRSCTEGIMQVVALSAKTVKRLPLTFTRSVCRLPLSSGITVDMRSEIMIQHVDQIMQYMCTLGYICAQPCLLDNTAVGRQKKGTKTCL